MRFGNGYDHNFVLRTTPADKTPKEIAQLYDPKSGRLMTVLTTNQEFSFIREIALKVQVKARMMLCMINGMDYVLKRNISQTQ